MWEVQEHAHGDTACFVKGGSGIRRGRHFENTRKVNFKFPEK